MLSRTFTVQTKPDATESEYAQETAMAIKALLLGLPDEVKALTFTRVLTGLDSDVQNIIWDMRLVAAAHRCFRAFSAIYAVEPGSPLDELHAALASIYEARHEKLCSTEVDHHEIQHCRCETALKWAELEASVLLKSCDP